MKVVYPLATVVCVAAFCFTAGRIAHLSAISIIGLTLAISGMLLLVRPSSAQTTGQSMAAQLEIIRAKYNVPALAGAIFTTEGLQEVFVTGVRKRDTTIQATPKDLWHFGSNTKMMTAALAGTFVAEGKLAWSDPVVKFFPAIKDQVSSAVRVVTIADVLRHRAGLIENLDWAALSKNGSLMEQRRKAAELALCSPKYTPGSFHYANTDYVVIGVVLEQILGKPWEDLMRERSFAPLKMESAGVGGTGTPGQVDQPWPHLDGGKPAPLNGPAMDNRPIMAPAGAVHGSIADWSKFLVDQLRGANGLAGFLPASIYRSMQTPADTSSGDTEEAAGYGFGWRVCMRPWAGGKALTHSGSNTMNLCVCWLAPDKKFGVLACTNQGGVQAFKACDKAVGALIERRLHQP